MTVQYKPGLTIKSNQKLRVCGAVVARVDFRWPSVTNVDGADTHRCCDKIWVQFLAHPQFLFLFFLRPLPMYPST